MAEYLSSFTGAEIDAAIQTVKNKESEWDGKQSALIGKKGQIVGFDETGAPVAQDDISASGSLDIYSQEETVVGQWIDGKPIYRRSFNGVISDGLNLTNSGNIEKIINQYGRFDVNPFPYTITVQFYTFLICQNQDIIMTAVGGPIGSLYDVTVEYTKTTDEATLAVASVDELNNAYDEGVQTA